MRILYHPNGSQICWGCLYNYPTATDSREIGNDGWRLPTKVEADSLVSYLGSDSADQVKYPGFTFWNSPNTSTNDTGLSAKGSGSLLTSIDEAIFLDRRNEAAYWTSDLWDSSSYFAYDIQISRYHPNVYVSYTNTAYCIAIRLVKDATGLVDGVTTVYTGNDGKTYNAVVINELYWLTEDLQETRYANGDGIEFLSASSNGFDWINWGTENPYASVYNNDLKYLCKEPKPVLGDVLYRGFGRLYNHHVATDSRNIANTGWHVLTLSEIWVLDEVTGPQGLPDGIGGSRFQDQSAVYWSLGELINPGTNPFNFNARGAGQLNMTSSAIYIFTVYNYMWTSNSVDGSPTNQYAYALGISGTRWRPGEYIPKKDFISIRLVKDTTTLSDGERGEYIGNDGTVYPTTCINGIEIISYNLKETKFRNGDIIPESGDWAVLQSNLGVPYSSYPNLDINNI